MATLADTDIQDLVTGTLNRLGKMRFNQIATRLQNYEVMGRMLKKDKLSFSDGKGIQRTIMVDHSDAAKQVGLHEVDNVNIGDVLQTIDIPWRHTTTNYAYERREILMNRGDSRIVDLMKVRRADAMIALAEHLETQFWTSPDASTNKLDMFGVPYWVVANTTEGHNGGNHSAFANGPGNLDSSTYTRWKNYTGQFPLGTTADLVDLMRTAYRKINFKSPVDINDFRKGTGDQYRIYTNEEVLQNLEDYAEGQNTNLGRDIASMDGHTTFRRNAVTWVPKLDSDPDGVVNPLYMLNLGYFHIVCLNGDYLRETEPTKAPSQHNTWVVHVDLTSNVLCTDRRCQAVFTGDG